MVSLNLLENLELKDEKNLLIQGLPSSVEKQFAKLSYAKSVTPLLKSKKVDFVLIFAVNQQQLKNILKDVFQALHENSKLWIAFPKQTSKISSDLMRENSWHFMTDLEYEGSTLIPVDHVWNAMKFLKMKDVVRDENYKTVEETLGPIVKEVRSDDTKKVKKRKTVKRETSFDNSTVQFPLELEKLFNTQTKTKDLFNALTESNQVDFLNWITDAKKHDTRVKRIEQLVEKLHAGKTKP
ncbi:MAG: YdeI/OmpD-associated family protein [Bacteroidota bacterium]